MKYEQAMWALARALYEMKRAAENGPWNAATVIERANWRNKAQQCLNGWGFDDFNGRLNARVAPASEMHAATRAAQEQYLKALYAKYGPYVARVQYHDAVNELAAYASEVAWEKLSDAEKGQLRHRVDIMLSARGFKNAGGEVAFEDKNDHFYRTVLSVLRDKHAAERVEALARKDFSAFHGEARQLLSARAYANFGRELLSGDDGTPGHGSEHKPAVEFIDSHLNDNTFEVEPPREGGVDRYDAVTAPVTAVAGAEDVMARSLYEAETPPTRKHWEDLRGDFQATYKMRAMALPLNLSELTETYRKQWAADVLAGRRQGEAPTLTPADDKIEERKVAAEMWVDQKLSDNGAKQIGVKIEDIEKVLREREPCTTEAHEIRSTEDLLKLLGPFGSLRVPVRTVKPAAERLDEKLAAARNKNTDYFKLGAFAYTAVRVMHPEMRPWVKLKLEEQLQIEKAAACAWKRLLMSADGGLLDVIYGAVSTFREIADLEGQDLATFVKCARMRVILPEPTKDEAELLAWYAHELCRVEIPGIVSWNQLASGDRERKVVDAYNYVTELTVNPHLVPEFYTALDIFLSDAANYAAKLDKLREARADWTGSFRQ